MSIFRVVACVGAWALLAAAAVAGETVLYAPPAAWIEATQAPPSKADGGGAVELLLQDSQIRLGPDGDEYFNETVMKVLTVAGLQQAGQVGITWHPSTQSLTINRLEIIRDGLTIDLLAGGDKFLVLRRENNLNLAMLDGRLTANKVIEDLRVGDTIRFATTTHNHDPAVNGHSESTAAWLNELPIGRLRLRATWPKSEPVRWKLGKGLNEPQVRSTPAGTELILEQSNFIPPKAPTGAPARYLVPATFELSDYADWRQVSASFAPLYKAAAAIDEGSAIKTEAANIRQAHSDPVNQMMAALKLVQEQVRYVYLEAGAGGYVPASAEQTWKRRFGDCKGKTALLLALLNEVGVAAAPALVNASGADGLDGMLPKAGAFDHVLVRAQIGGRIYWLDGTRTGTTLADAQTPPNLDWALPLTIAGADLERLEIPPPALPLHEVILEMDASAGLDLDGPVTVEQIVRGQDVSTYRQIFDTAPRAQVEQALREAFEKDYEWISVQSFGYAFEGDGSFRLRAKGVGKNSWRLDASSRSRTWYVAGTGFNVEFPQRKDEIDADAPFVMNYPAYTRNVARIHLPRGGAGFTISGSDLDTTIAGVELIRASKLDGEWATIEMTERALKSEVSAAEARAAKAEIAKLKVDQYVQVRAPRSYRETTTEADARVSETPTAAAILRRGYAKQQSKRFEEALADYDEAVRLEPKLDEALIARADLSRLLGRTDAALQDIRKIIDRSPNDERAYAIAMSILLQTDRTDEVLTLIGQAERNGAMTGEMQRYRAFLLNKSGDRERAIEEADAAVRLNPTDPRLIAYAAYLKAPLDAPEHVRARAEAEALGKLIATAPTPEAHLQRARSLGRAGDEGGAITEYGRSIDLKPTADAYVERGELRGRGGDFAAAQTDFDAAIGLVPSSATYISRALFHFRQAQFDEAEADYAQALRINPEELDAKIGLITVVSARGDQDQAVALYGEVIEAHPDAYNARLGRAQILIKLGDDAAAESDLRTILDAGPAAEGRDIQAMYVLARLQARTQRYDAALATYDKLVEATTGDAVSLNERCWFKATRNFRAETAIADCTRSLALAPEKAATLDSRGFAHLRTGDYEAAIRDYDQSLKAQPEHAYSLYGRGLARIRKGDEAGGEADLEAAQRISAGIATEFDEFGLRP